MTTCLTPPPHDPDHTDRAGSGHSAVEAAESTESTESTGLDELHYFLTAYRPSDVAEPTWMQMAADAVALVVRAGQPTRLRVEKDIQCLGHVVAHLVERGRPVTLQEVLEDRTILSYDLLLQQRSAASRTRENQRGILRRLQAVHRGLPWRQPRRADGERIAAMVDPGVLDQLLRIEALAEAEVGTTVDEGDSADARLFIASLSAARAARAARAGYEGRISPQVSVQVSASTWAAARRFAERHGLYLTKPILDAALTHQVLRQDEPAAVLIARHCLTRRELDLALTSAQALPPAPTAAHRDLLRGTPSRNAEARSQNSG